MKRKTLRDPDKSLDLDGQHGTDSTRDNTGLLLMLCRLDSKYSTDCDFERLYKRQAPHLMESRNTDDTLGAEPTPLHAVTRPNNVHVRKIRQG